ncbi:MAG: hypothetical protein KGL39_38245 [Patescibacteria group bacterium]|nr:hypothetical protein [Patescibacteria group bacterium]
MESFRERVLRFFGPRKLAYKRTFNTTSGREVLQDLAKFCRAYESTFSADERAHVLIEGRREVWLRIQAHLNLTEEEIWGLFSGRPGDVPTRVISTGGEDGG